MKANSAGPPGTATRSGSIRCWKPAPSRPTWWRCYPARKGLTSRRLTRSTPPRRSSPPAGRRWSVSKSSLYPDSRLADRTVGGAARPPPPPPRGGGGGGGGAPPPPPTAPPRELVRRPSFFCIFQLIPDRADPDPRLPQLRGARGGPDPRQLPPAGEPRRHERLRNVDPDQPHDRHPRGPVRVPPGVGGLAREASRSASVDDHHLLRSSLQLRGRPAGGRVHLHPGPRRGGHAPRRIVRVRPV